MPSNGIDSSGDYVCLGLIELHIDILANYLQPRPQVFWHDAITIIAHDRQLARTGMITVFEPMRVGSIPLNTCGAGKNTLETLRRFK